MDPRSDTLLVAFPGFSSSILQKLNQQRKLGQLCDITVVIQGYHYRAHRAVLAAGSPYFCDQVLLKSSARVVLPDIMRPSVFESLLQSCYTGTLQLPPGELVAFLTAASFLQMWHVVDKCTELLGGQKSLPCRDLTAPDDNSPGECLVDVSHGGSAEKFPDYGDGGVGMGQGFGAVDSPMSEPELPTAEEVGLSVSEDNGDIWPLCAQDDNSGCVLVKDEGLKQDEVGSSSKGDPGASHAGLRPLSSYTGARERDHSFEEESGGKVLLKVPPLGCVSPPVDNIPVNVDEESSAGGWEDNSESVQVKASNPGPAGAVNVLHPYLCGKNFTPKSQRDRHGGIHLGPRPYSRSVCGKALETKHQPLCHMKSHAGAAPVHCSICGKKFKCPDSLTQRVPSCICSVSERCGAAEQTTQIC
ncbi:zinc finger and BTB domain-containing protein 43-like [Scleropages formosus]|uniref:zinc finger and BTB domain-containing protein 43-like n=1 Tax=Scleropages formosus TaxID=113540 RepID=UPI0010FA7670|nr:zinc finger and BTB domain-containing protein 43 [Scleropages formosus]